jgi:hypothetical protein
LVAERESDQPSDPNRTPDANAELKSNAEIEDPSTQTDFLGDLLEETSLWPILLVVLFSTGAFGAGMIVLAIGDRNPFAAGALLLVAGMTVDTLIRATRRSGLRTIAKLIALFWVISIGLALVALFSGIA